MHGPPAEHVHEVLSNTCSYREVKTEMPSEAQRIRRSLRDAGFTTGAIDAVWPKWWSEDAESSASATAELRYSLSRRLGLAPASLFETEPTFVWTDDTLFKNLGAATDREAAILASFSVAVGRSAIAATTAVDQTLVGVSAVDLRAAILASAEWVGLRELASVCWGIGIPLLGLEVFPLRQKRMHAATARVEDRHAILVGRQSSFPAQVAYYVAHEIGHIALGHSVESAALLDIGDPLQPVDPDDDERAADRYALELLTGSPDPRIEASVEQFTAKSLADAVLEQGPPHHIDPGVLALCMGHRSGRWPQVFKALRRIMSDEQPDVTGELNRLARAQFDWDLLPFDTQDFLETVMGGRDRERGDDA